MKNNKIKNFDLNVSGFELKKNIISRTYIHKINKDIKNAMKNYVDKKYYNKSNSFLFNLVSKKSKKLRSNLFKSFSNLVSCIEILSDKNIKKFLLKKKYNNLVLVNFSIIIMEPKLNTYLFLF